MRRPFARAPFTLTLTEPAALTPRRRVTATASRPRFAAPVTATPAGACATRSETVLPFGTDAMPTATCPSAGTGIFTVAAAAVAAHSRASRSVSGRRRRVADMAATVRPRPRRPHREVS